VRLLLGRFFKLAEDKGLVKEVLQRLGLCDCTLT